MKIMASRSEELDQFKRINLTEYAASIGSQLDRKAKSENSIVMKDASGDKIIIAINNHSRHWMYFTVGFNTDNGTIIDFVQNKRDGSLGDVRKELRPWIGQSSTIITRPSPDKFVPELEPISKNLCQVRAEYESMKVLAGYNSYLVEERKIPVDVLTHPRFSDRIRVDDRNRHNNIVFPHFNREGICGFGLKNSGFTGFSKSGEKGIWTSTLAKSDSTLVITESAIDALSYATLKQKNNARYISIGGEMNQSQPDLLKSAMEKMPKGSTIVLALDADEGGRSLTEKITAIFLTVKGPGLTLVHDRPSKSQDWNDVLRALYREKQPCFNYG